MFRMKKKQSQLRWNAKVQNKFRMKWKCLQLVQNEMENLTTSLE